MKKILVFVFTLFTYTAQADHPSVALSVGTVAASPIATESAKTNSKGTLVTGFRAEYIKFDEYSDMKLQDLREAGAETDIHSVESLWSLSVSAAYSISDDLTVGIRFPFIMRDNIREPEHDHQGADAEIEALGNIEGIGDTTFYGQYRFFTNEGTHVSALFGIKTPTGKTNRVAIHEGEREVLDVEFQPGSGAWSGILGLAVTQEFGALSVDASTVYTVSSEGVQETDLGDIFSYNFALSYRLFNQKDFAYQVAKMSFDTILEFNAEWRAKEENQAIKDNNSGGNIAYISPGYAFQ